MSKKNTHNPLSKPLAIMSLATLTTTGVSVSFESLNWMMDYLIWGWAISFAILAIWTIFALRLGVIIISDNRGKLSKIYRSKEPVYFYFSVVFYMVLGVVGSVSIIYSLISIN